MAYIDWSPFFHAWELSGSYPKILDDPEKGPHARELLADAEAPGTYRGCIPIAREGRWAFEIDCAAGEEVVKVDATASLAGGRTDGVASFAGWQIFGAAGEYDNSDCRVRVNIAAGARDTQAFLEQISFHVNVLAKVKE